MGPKIITAENNIKKNVVTLAITSLSIFVSTASFAGAMGASNHHEFSISGSIGALGGESREYVYAENGRKVSQINWKIKPAAILQAEMNYDVLSWLSAHVRGWTTIAKRTTVMDDYDWLNPNQSNWTEWSHHENTQMNYANDLDLNLRAWLWKNTNLKLGATLGYERNAFDFKAIGGCYQYQSGKLTGCFANVPGIAYQQTFNTPYVGLIGKYNIDRFELAAVAKYSNWVQAKDQDQHFMRDLTFKETSDRSNYYSLMLDAGYRVTNNLKVFTQASYNQYSRTKADTEVIDNTSGETAFLPNSAGLYNKNYTLAVGVHYLF